MTTTPTTARRARRPGRGARTPQTGVDALFGRFWPESGLGSGLRTVVAAAAAGVFAGAALSFTAVGISWTLVLVACGAAALLTARHRREPWTLLCSASGAPARPADDPPRRLVDPDARDGGRRRRLPVRDHRGAHGAGHRAVRDRLAARLAAWPALVRPFAAHRGHRRPYARPGPHGRVVAPGAGGLRHDLRERQPGLRVLGRPAGAQPDLQRPRRAGVPRLLRLRRHAGCGLPRPQPGGGGRAGGPASCSAGQPVRVAGAGPRRGCRVPGLHRRPGPGALRRPRLHRGHDRADLRRLRPPGLRPADPRHRAHRAGRVGRLPAGGRGRRRTGAGCSPRSVSCAG